MANGWSLLIGLIVVVAAGVAAWLFSPKGENQTLWRSTLILSLASCYLMWCMFFLPSPLPPSTTIQDPRPQRQQHMLICLAPTAAITFLAQWHPLISPRRADIRPDRVPQ
ncbi:hypothetical protein BJX62DRAFT_165774 [Aspergillus germanicus]